jgi:hypothetical protein
MPLRIWFSSFRALSRADEANPAILDVEQNCTDYCADPSAPMALRQLLDLADKQLKWQRMQIRKPLNNKRRYGSESDKFCFLSSWQLPFICLP